MATRTNLDFVSLQVRDMRVSEIFYRDVMGFKTGRSPNPHAIVFETESGSIFAIRTPLVDLDQIREIGAGISLWFKVLDPDALFRELVEKNISILKPIENGPFGRVFTVRDPDGYAITIHGGI